MVEGSNFKPNVVIGFNGLVVEGGCGIRSTLTSNQIHRACGGRYTFQDLTEGGFVTNLQRPMLAVVGSVVLYATHKWLCPNGDPCIPWEGSIPWEHPTKGLSHKIYIQYGPLKEAENQMQQWGIWLTLAAEQLLRDHHDGKARNLLDVAWRTVSRARYVLSQLSDPHFDLQAFALSLRIRESQKAERLSQS